MSCILSSTRPEVTQSVCRGNFPNVEEQLNQGDKIIIVSTYSNTIKVPHCNVINGITEWEWEEYMYELTI